MPVILVVWTLATAAPAYYAFEKGWFKQGEFENVSSCQKYAEKIGGKFQCEEVINKQRKYKCLVN